MFDEKTISHLNYYVYALFSDDEQLPFYIGKGVGNRVFNHLQCAIRDENLSSLKYDKLRTSKHVRHIIIRHGLSEDEAFSVEGALIDIFNYVCPERPLTNMQSGHNSLECGLMNSDEIMARYNAEELNELSEDSIIININRTYKRGNSGTEVYDATREIWTINERRINEIRYVLSEFRGLIVEVFEVDEWYLKDRGYGENSKRAGETRKGYGFVGHVAPDAIRKLSINKSIKRYKQKGQAFPVTYKLNKVARILNGYERDLDLVEFAFKWNGKHGEEFLDANEAFRTELIESVIRSPDKASFPLVRDLFIEYTKWCQESFCIGSEFAELSKLYFTSCEADDFGEYLSRLDSSMDAWLAGLNFKMSRDDFDKVAQKLLSERQSHQNANPSPVFERGLKQIEERVVRD